MKKTALAFALVFGVGLASPAFAQLGALSKIKRGADAARKVSDLNISDKDERAIGDEVSRQIIAELGVYQDEALTKYVSLIGMLLAQQSEKPNLNWQFIILDTDGVNAYAAPGGIIHITRGALAMIKSESELAGVLGHEITHITERHAITSIKRSRGLELASDELGDGGSLLASAVGKLAEVGTKVLLFNEFDRGQEMESDKTGLLLAHKAGYSPAGMNTFLTSLSGRNKGREEPNGLFATHPQLKERIDENVKTAREKKLTSTAVGDARYASSVKVQASDMAAIVVVPRGARGAAAEPTAKNEDKKEEPKRRGLGGLGGLGSALTKGKQAESTQASASAGGRMVGPDTNSVGGTNKNPVRVTITPAEIAEFKKGIA
jgi:predicted Zn-dependent protease